MKLVSIVDFQSKCLIELTPSLENSIAECLRPYSHAVLVFDPNTVIFREELETSINNTGLRSDCIIIPRGGESSKALDCYIKIVSDAIDSNFLRRQSTFVAVGGGSVMDLVGFVAATFQRGVSYINVPTTLLGMVDASIGGKTAINLTQGKHLLGAFHYPKTVIIDINKLSTLPDRVYEAGFSEVVKAALISGDSSLFEYLEAHFQEAKAKESEILNEIILNSIKIKLLFIEHDWQESELDRFLNLGHEIAHSLEAAAQFDDTVILHGEAVLIGLFVATRLSLKRGLISLSLYQRIIRLLTRLSSFRLAKDSYSPNILLGKLKVISAIRDGNLRMVLPMQPVGKARVFHDVTPDELIQTLEECSIEIT